MDFIKVNAKAIVGFIVTAIAQAIVDARASGDALPAIDDWKGWLAFVGISLGGAVVVWATGNKLDLKQVLNTVPKLEPVAQKAVAQKALTELPDDLSDGVIDGYPNWTTG